MSAHTETSPQDTIENDADEQETDEELTRDDIFHALQCRRRRLVLKYLHEHERHDEYEGSADMSDIAEHIAAIENDTDITSLRSQERQRVYIALYQSHLPKLDKAGVIRYEQNRGTVKRTELTDEFSPYLVEEPSMLTDDSTVASESRPASTSADEDESDESSAPWHQRYLFASGGSLALLVATYLGLFPTASSAGFGVTAMIAVVFMLLATAHWSTESET